MLGLVLLCVPVTCDPTCEHDDGRATRYYKILQVHYYYYYYSAVGGATLLSNDLQLVFLFFLF
jgi:hypothetical protein